MNVDFCDEWLRHTSQKYYCATIPDFTPCRVVSRLNVPAGLGLHQSSPETAILQDLPIREDGIPQPSKRQVASVPEERVRQMHDDYRKMLAHPARLRMPFRVFYSGIYLEHNNALYTSF